jgi:hypothetical protein
VSHLQDEFDACPNCEKPGHEHTTLNESKVWLCPEMPQGEIRSFPFGDLENNTLQHHYARHPDTYWPAEHPKVP